MKIAKLYGINLLILVSIEIGNPPYCIDSNISYIRSEIDQYLPIFESKLQSSCIISGIGMIVLARHR